MSFNDCLRSALDQGAVTPEEAEALRARFDELRGQGTLDLAGARAQLEQELRAASVESRRQAVLTARRRQELLTNLATYRDSRGRPDILEAALGFLEHFGFHGYSSVEGRARAIVGLAHARLEEGLARYSRTIPRGRRRQQAELPDVVRALFGETVQSPEAQAFARVWADVAEGLRQRFNAAGGAIPKLESWGLPQWHDARAVVNAGREQWKNFIRPRLDPARMRDPLTGAPLTPARLEGALDAVYERIVTDGVIDRAPTGVNRGTSLANQHQDHRFLVFKSADDWLAYAESFGQGDPFAVMMHHVRGMARDVAALEVLGPNPSATVEWLIQTVEREQARAVAGQPSLFRADGPAAAFNRGAGARWRLESLWGQVRGGEVVSSRMANGFAAIRNAITSAVLGSASITALATDPFLANMARRLSGLPTATWLGDVARTFTRYNRREAVRAGLILDDALHVLGTEARYAGALGGPEWSRWLADRTLVLSGLTPWTQARKHMFGMEFQAALADVVENGTAWSALDPRLQRVLAGYGIGPTEFATLSRATIHRSDPDAAGVLRPAEIAEIDPALAERYLEMILSETERAVPSGTKRSRALLMGNLRGGTFIGELVGGALQFKSFALSFTMNQLEAMSQEVGSFGRARGARYAGALLISMTLGGALALQLKQIINGKDPMRADDPRFWMQAIGTGGGFGLFGDFLFADLNRFGQGIQETILGPTIGAVNDFGRATVGNLQKLALGEETTFAADVVQKGARYVPGASLFYLRAAWQRVVVDQLQRLADPAAHRKFRERERRLTRETGQEYWWRPGELAPARAPALP